MPKRRRSDRDMLGELHQPSPADYAEYDGPKTRNVKPLTPQTEAQDDYMRAINGSQLAFGLGPAGTGKTYVAAAMAADALKKQKIKKLILTRPAVEAGESLGFLPGVLDEKYEPFIRPFIDVLHDRLGKGFTGYALKDKRIEGLPLAYMRGMTFKDCMVILDEAQNTTPVQMKMFLTRIGEGSTVIINGDLSQKDINGRSGLADAVQRVAHLRDVRVVHFTRDDVVRSGLVQEIIDSYALPDEAEAPEGIIPAPGTVSMTQGLARFLSAGEDPA